MNATAQQALDWLADQRQAMETLLQRIVDTDSNSYDKAGVDAVGALLAAELEADGILLKRMPVDGFGDVMLAEVPGEPGKPVLLLGHRDTVFPKGTTATRSYSRDGNLAHGPGVADMKGGLVLNCFALKALKRAGQLPYPVQVLYTGDEEIGSGSARPHIEQAARAARAVLNTEPGRASGNVVSARKGGATLVVEVFGRAAHAGVNHADGASAIEALARKIIKFHALTDYPAGITTNVGLMSGGTSSNTVAPSASARLDVRFIELKHWDRIFSTIQAIVAEEELIGTHAILKKRRPFYRWKPITANGCCTSTNKKRWRWVSASKASSPAVVPTPDSPPAWAFRPCVASGRWVAKSILIVNIWNWTRWCLAHRRWWRPSWLLARAVEITGRRDQSPKQEQDTRPASM